MGSKLARVGFVADTHGRKNDGSDLPDSALAALAGVDLIVCLGDIGKKVIVERLSAVAPVMVPSEDRKGYVAAGDAEAAPTKVLDMGGVRVGLVFNLSQPDKKIEVREDGVPRFPDGPLEPLLLRRFKQPVHVVAFGGTHRQHEQQHDGVLFLNPGSPTLPSDRRDDADRGSVAILSVPDGVPTVEFHRLS